MAIFNLSRQSIPLINQQILVDGEPARNLWCAEINCAAGLGGTSATFDVPYYMADEIGNLYHNKKVIVKLGHGGKLVTSFIGYISGKYEEQGPNSNFVSVTAQTAGHFLLHRGVGEDTGNWHYNYPLFNDKTGNPTGWTPAGVLYDLFTRLPVEWLTELKLGNLAALGGAWDLPVVGYDFSLSTYADAVNAIVDSLGDIYVVERFFENYTYLDFVRISDPVAPRIYSKLCSGDDFSDTDANIGVITVQDSSDMVINKVHCFGQDMEFMVSSRSVVPSLPQHSEPAFTPGYYPTALRKNWDVSLEAFALKDPDLCSSDKIGRSCTVRQHLWGSHFADGKADGDPSPTLAAPGTNGTEFYVSCGIDLLVNKTVLIHPESGERMLVTAYVPSEEAYQEGDEIPGPLPAPIATESRSEKRGKVTVTRNYQPQVTPPVPGNILYDDVLQIEVPGLGKVFREYKLPEILKTYPEKKFLNDIPVFDADGKRTDRYAFIVRSTLYPDPLSQDRRLGKFGDKPSRLDTTRFDFNKMTVTLGEPAVALTDETLTKKVKTDEDGKETVTYHVQRNYTETVAGITFSYIDPRWPFGYSTGITQSDIFLPWLSHISRIRNEDWLYQQTTSTGYPIIDNFDNPITFGCIHVDEETGDVFSGAGIIRNDLAYLQNAAVRHLLERNKKRISASVEIPWLDLGYKMGYQLVPVGLKKQINDKLMITGVSYITPRTGEHHTVVQLDNVKPPYRKRWSKQLTQEGRFNNRQNKSQLKGSQKYEL